MFSYVSNYTCAFITFQRIQGPISLQRKAKSDKNYQGILSSDHIESL